MWLPKAILFVDAEQVVCVQVLCVIHCYDSLFIRQRSPETIRERGWFTPILKPFCCQRATDAESQNSLLKSHSSPGSGSQISNIWRLEINPAWSYRRAFGFTKGLSVISELIVGTRFWPRSEAGDGCCSWINPPTCNTMWRRWCYPMCIIWWFLID